MDENNNLNNENNENLNNKAQDVNKHICFENHCWKMCLGMVIAAFLGGFLASYFVVDQMAERQYKRFSYSPFLYENRILNNHDRIYQKNLKEFEKVFEKDKDDDFSGLSIPGLLGNTVKIKSGFNDNHFEVTVDLKPFRYDENKVNYNIQRRKITVFGSSDTKNSDYEESISFAQDFILPDNADITNVEKKKIGNNLVISVPLK